MNISTYLAEIYSKHNSLYFSLSFLSSILSPFFSFFSSHYSPFHLFQLSPPPLPPSFHFTIYLFFYSLLCARPTLTFPSPGLIFPFSTQTYLLSLFPSSLSILPFLLSLFQYFFLCFLQSPKMIQINTKNTGKQIIPKRHPAKRYI